MIPPGEGRRYRTCTSYARQEWLAVSIYEQSDSDKQAPQGGQHPYRLCARVPRARRGWRFAARDHRRDQVQHLSVQLDPPVRTSGQGDDLASRAIMSPQPRMVVKPALNNRNAQAALD